MSKQVKIGFDKTASRSIETDQVLVDIRGNLLRDEAGNFLYTKTNVELPGFFAADNSMSIHTNNEKGSAVYIGGPIPVEEQFPELSAVSSSLLGVPRKNVQQSLLADVSIYGLDSNTWEFYRNPNPYAPTEWIRRSNKVYGEHFYPRLKEHADQQALAIEAYPTPWTFPWGPKFEDQGRYNSNLFPLYLNFVKMGNDLYQYFKFTLNLNDFAERYFLPPIDTSREDGGGVGIDLSGLDVEYNENFNTAMTHIEKWTMTWMDIRDGLLEDPRNLPSSLKTLSFQRISDLLGISYTQSNTRPGYRSDGYYYAQIQSKEAFRYQPGAISGFTFGIKINFDETSTSNKIEWGCANETDQYMFQLAGSNFNIVRRSTVALTVKALEANGLKESDQIVALSPNPFERPGAELLNGEYNPINELPRYETVISQDQFNGDPLNGSGPSQYNISFQEVTMFKIEYSWYGAIGAKFYAYVPVGHGECRWVLIHTLIIENTLKYPALRNPYMHFRYTTVINETSGLRAPIYIYKYGASYYIDGSDEGSFTFDSYTREEKEIVNNQSKPVIGFQTKEFILNRDGIETPNQKNFFIDRITASTDKNSRIDILECEGCKNGFGHFYSTGLVNGQRAQTHDFEIVNGSTLVFANPELNETFTLADTGKKIVAPGVYSAYIYPNEGDLTTATIKRKRGNTTNNEPSSPGFSSTTSALINGTPVGLYNYTFSGKLYGFEDIAVANTPLFKNKIQFKFLNPASNEPTSHFREFRVGVTNKTPSLGLDGELLFNDEVLNIDEEIYLEYSQYQAEKNMNGDETREFEPRIGYVMEDDYRIPRPKGSNSGECSTVNIDVTDVSSDVSYVNTVPPLGSGNYLVFENDPNITLLGGEIGIWDGNKYVTAQSGGSNITFTSNIQTYTNEALEIVKFASISHPLTSIPNGKIAFRIISMTARHVSKQKISKFDIYPLYVFVAMHDNARIYNIVITEQDGNSILTHAPYWIIGSESNIEKLEVGNQIPSSSIKDVIGTNEYIGLDGLFNMGGVSSEENPPANFVDKSRLNGVRYDNQLNLPLRPGSIKYTFFAGANETIDMDASHIFGIDRFKITKGAFNNKSVYINSRVLDEGESGKISINILGKEQ